MFKNYLKTSLRFLAKNKGFSLINIAGLSIGTFCCLYILLYVRDQFSYDRYFSHSGDMYRVVTQVGELRSGSPCIQATTTPPVAPALAADFREILTSTRVIPTLGSEQHLLRYKDQELYEKSAYLVDPNFFDLFDFHFSAGSAGNALKGPGDIVLSKPVAEKLFGTDDPIGKEVFIQDGYGDNHFKVSGVVDETFGKSSIQAGLFFRMTPDMFHFLADTSWVDHNFVYTFIKLNPGHTASEVERKLPAFLTQHIGSPSGNGDQRKEFHLQPIVDIHTTGTYEGEMRKTVSGFFLDILMGIAVLIQLIACINFMNLSTARASRRAKEVGVRKIIGADKKGLILQFLVESFLLSLLAMLISMPLLLILLPWLNQLTGAEIQLALFADPAIWLMLAAIATVTGILAGSYPAFYLSAFQAPKVLKGDFINHVSVGGLRRSLVIFQFVLSIVLISAIIIIRQQMDYIQSRDLGFSKDQQIIFSFYTYATKKCALYFALGLRQYPEISEASQTDNYPGGFHYQDEHIYLPGANAGKAVAIQALSSDEHFLKTLSIPMISGRDFSPFDTGWVIINQTLAERLGLDSSKAPGTTIYSINGAKYKIAGVLKDFNYQSLHDQISPFMLVYKHNRFDFSHLIVKASASRYTPLLEKMESLWKRRVFMAPFEYSFLSDNVQKMYETEIIMSRIINSFTVMAIVISCLGLFGLAAFNAEQRTKEIGIRKIMGASIPGIIRLLSVDFLTLICIAFLLAAPITSLIMNRWLAIFAYHIGISWWVFALSGGTSIVIAMSIVGFQAFKAAIVNPVESLRAP
jgi:putative ABC transport system permease protein